jgi:hypothetical protein
MDSHTLSDSAFSGKGFGYDGAVRIALCVLALAGCTKGDPDRCRIDVYAAGDEEGQSATDCGSFTLNSDGGYDDASMQQAHDCVLDAVARGHAFQLLFDVWDVYRHVRGGFTGSLDAQGKLQTRAYAYVGDTLGGSFDPRPAVTMESCKSVVDDVGCTPAAGKPCLTCQTPGAAATLCYF